MSVVAIRLAGPLQSWGSSSRFVRRGTEREPTKSGVIGLVAAAKGLRRTDALEDLLDLRLGVRKDQPGRLERDFQTARRANRVRGGEVRWESLPLSYRYYLSDAVFLAVLEGERTLLEGLDEALRSPVFPLYLGRRSCPPAGPVALGIYELGMEQALAELPWLASAREQRRHRSTKVSLETVQDAAAGTIGAETFHDEPVSFDPNRRRYEWRSVVRGSVAVSNPHGVLEPEAVHDPMSALGG